MQTSKKKQALKLAVALAVTYATSAAGAVASLSAKSFYTALERPSWAPPGWLFGPVWTLLYTLMGISAWLVWRKAKTAHILPELGIYAAQLCANGLWSWFFFKWQMGAAAFIDILILLALLIANISMFWRHSKWAGILLLPYLAWASFAALLCYQIWQMNPQELG